MRRKLLGGLILAGLCSGAWAQTLAGWASLPPESRISGPTAGRYLERAPFLDVQPVQGFSSLVHVDGDEYLGLVDNGFGRKSNSADFLLQVHRLAIDFRSSRARIISSLPLTDPQEYLEGQPVYRRVVYPDRFDPVDPVIGAGRLLTGFDFDPESLEIDGLGRLWIGDEFGPYLLRFDARGRLQQAPISHPALVSPDHPVLGDSPTIVRSGGFEAAGLQGSVLHLLLEKPAVEARALAWYRFDTARSRWLDTTPFRHYPLAEGATAVGAMAALGDGRFLLVERDSAEHEAARHKRLVLIDLARHRDQVLLRHELLDLLAIPDPDERHPEPGPYRMPFWTIESVAVRDDHHLVIANDNNYPFSRGRGGEPGSEATEFALIRFPVTMKDLVPRH